MKNEIIDEFVKGFYCISPDAKDNERFEINLWSLKVCFKRAYEIGYANCKNDVIDMIRKEM